MPKSVTAAPLLAFVLLTLVAAPSAQAQGVYRIVGPDGKVTFSDRPPPDGNAQPARAGAAAAPSAGNDALPYELRQLSNRFPVTLYTGTDCSPCTVARAYLVSRGIPFTERTVSTTEDITALQRLSGSDIVPFATIGGQHLSGFSQSEWAQYLDAAGYPKQSQLPRNYRQPAPTPLVAVAPAVPASAAASTPAPTRPAAQRQRPPAPVNQGPTPSNPAGIQF